MTEPGEGRRAKYVRDVLRLLKARREHIDEGGETTVDLTGYEIDALLAALEGAEPVAWTWRYELQSEWFYRRGPTKPTLAKELADIFPLYRHPPEHGTGRGEVVRCVVEDILPGGSILVMARGPFQLKPGDSVQLLIQEAGT